MQWAPKREGFVCLEDEKELEYGILDDDQHKNEAHLIWDTPLAYN